jgi:hypothetical protein
MIKEYFYSIGIITIGIACTTLLVLGTTIVGNYQEHVNAAQVQSNSTSTICVNEKPCVTTICINNQPCHTITSNSTNTDNSTNKNKALDLPFPQATI